ncbi:DNA topoisomerase 3 [Comamonas thiooxydans]|uniref:DNA topoisomerase 3 n=1 Tax=Comamonas thiooxydans TaxID=363952 RepID=UPI00311F0C58
MRLIVAEKPSVAKAIAEELGVASRGNGFFVCKDGSTVTSCFGHMHEQLGPDEYTADDIPRATNGRKVWRPQDLPIIPKVWKTAAKEEAKERLQVIADLFKKASSVVNAGDPDREGQLLVDEVIDANGWQGPELRYWSSATDATSVQRALANLQPNAQFRRYGLAARARSRVDWLIGMNLTRAFTLRARRGGSSALLTVGRVQTPTLALVVERDRAIENFKAAAYFNVLAELQHQGGNFKAKWQAGEGAKGLDEEGRLTDKAVAEALKASCTGKPGNITEYKQEAKKEKQPRSYSLADVTLAASQKFGYSADDVLKICQALYETHKLTSYPRTDCAYLPESQHADAPQVLAAVAHVNPHLAALVAKADPSIKSPTWDDKQVTAHHGIVPTMHRGDLAALSDKEKNVYELILRAYLAQFFPVHEYMATTVTAQVAGESFKATGKVITAAGWREVYQEPEADDQADEKAEADDQALPAMNQGDSVTAKAITLQAQKTKAPPRFTDGTLLKAMENIYKYMEDEEQRRILKDGEGIGTPATRSSIIKELKAREFLGTKGKQIISTELGRGLVDAMPPDVKSASLTALNERELRAIETTGQGVDEFVSLQAAFVSQHVEQANASNEALAGTLGPACPRCKEGHLKRWPRKEKGGHFWACDKYRETGCKFACDDKAGKPDLSVAKAYKCPKCEGGQIRLLTGGASGKFWGCSNYRNGCRVTYPDKNGKPDTGAKPAAKKAAPGKPAA